MIKKFQMDVLKPKDDPPETVSFSLVQYDIPKRSGFGWGGWEISDSGHFIGLSLFNVSSAIINIQRDIP